MNSLLNQLKLNPFVLAPMAGITDCAFRSFMKDMGCSIVITELVSATGLKYNSKKTIDLMKYSESQRPIGVQIFGENLEDLDYAGKIVEQSGADFIDLNFGCPVPKVVKKGAGAAILKDLKRVEQVFKTIKSATSLPVTVKVRTGWDDQSRNTVDLCHIAYNEGLSWVAIHGRTRAQGYKGQSDWEYIKDVKAKSKIPILGNGDICTAEQAVQKLKESSCDGVMIGRGCLKNPWLFQESVNLLIKQKILDKGLTEAVNASFEDVFKKLNSQYSLCTSDKIRVLQLKKLSSWYSAGLPGSTQFRKEIFKAENSEQVLFNIRGFFNKYDPTSIKSYNNNGFLMGGHG
ncbi:MAG: tRNA dihydrouridine synthase DusB [Bdellovibrionaceae bacterium]|nr:tRNA dihydrouridine synthase DusB [Pseudobdellovibrionaceae bacterium]